MEALYPHARAERANLTRRPPDARDGYLAQAEMRELIAAALARGWTLLPYETDVRAMPANLDPRSDQATNWRDGEQARNLQRAIAELPRTAAVLVWCGNHHLAREPIDGWRPMASLLPELGVEPFSIDQTATVQFDLCGPEVTEAWATAFVGELIDRGGTAGFLADDAPAGWPLRELADAYLLSTDNTMA